MLVAVNPTLKRSTLQQHRRIHHHNNSNNHNNSSSKLFLRELLLFTQFNLISSRYLVDISKNQTVSTFLLLFIFIIINSSSLKSGNCKIIFNSHANNRAIQYGSEHLVSIVYHCHIRHLNYKVFKRIYASEKN